MKATLIDRCVFYGSVGCLASTYFVVIGLMHGQGTIDLTGIRIINDSIFFAAIVLLIGNVLNPIFKTTILELPLKPNAALWIILVDIFAFQALVIVGLNGLADFWSLYKKRIVPLQLMNLVFVWACLAALIGQTQFSPFWRNVMRRPLYTFGTLLVKK
jgi:hypothetical protein